MSRTWKLSFKVKPLAVVSIDQYANILYGVIKQNQFLVGVWFPRGTTKIYICATINYQADCGDIKTPLPLLKFSTITIQQILIGNQYRFQVFINGKIGIDAVNRQPQVFKDVTFYAANPASKAVANGIIGDFKVDENYGGN